MANEITPLPTFFITQDILEQRKAAFESDKLPLLTGAIGKPDTKNIWYSRDHIAQLLNEIDYYGGDGLRIFFGKYEDSNESFSGQLCLVMNPTRAVNSGGVITHQNIIAENEADFSERSALPKTIPLSPDGSAFADKGYNYGSPCPPLCD
jgi:hypothetical protein